MLSLISSSLASIVLVVILLKFGKIKLDIPFLHTAEPFGPVPAVRYLPREYPIDSIDALPV